MLWPREGGAGRGRERLVQKKPEVEGEGRPGAEHPDGGRSKRPASLGSQWGGASRLVALPDRGRTGDREAIQSGLHLNANLPHSRFLKC